MCIKHNDLKESLTVKELRKVIENLHDDDPIFIKGYNETNYEFVAQCYATKLGITVGEFEKYGAEVRQRTGVFISA